MINRENIDNIRDGPTIGVSAVLKFHGRGYLPNETLVVFYPSGVNALNWPIALELIKLGYEVCVMYYDASTQQYF